MDQIDDESLRRALATVGLEGADPNRIRRGVANVLEEVAVLETDEDSTRSIEARSPVEGDDEWNAIRWRFDLPADDGPLRDLRVAVKENVAVAGVRTTCGSAGFETVPGRHASVVDRLIDAGAPIVASTNMDEFALYTTGERCAHGTIRNPRVADHVPGGSSGGSGAAVAAGLVDAALGTDTGGSVRIPASYCGVVGLKPTYASVSRFGVVDLSPSLDHVGPIAGDVATVARVFDAIAGPDSRDPTTLGAGPPVATDGLGAPIDGWRVAVVDEAFDSASEPVADSVRDALSALPIEVDSVSLPFHAAGLAAAHITTLEFASLFGAGSVPAADGRARGPFQSALAAVDPGGLGSLVRDELAVGAGTVAATGGTAYETATAWRAAFTRRVDELLETYDAIVTPTTPDTAPTFGAVRTREDLLRTMLDTAPFDLTGHPALSVPVGTVDGAPVGAQVVTAHHGERAAVALGAALERGTDG